MKVEITPLPLRDPKSLLLLNLFSDIPLLLSNLFSDIPLLLLNLFLFSTCILLGLLLFAPDILLFSNFLFLVYLERWSLCFIQNLYF